MMCTKWKIAVLTVMALWVMVCADVIEPGYHPLSRCVTIVNGNEFPDIVLVGAYKGINMGGKITRYVIHEDSCLEKGYKFNTLYIFWVERSYLESEGLENLPVENFMVQIAAKKQSSFKPPVMALITSDINPYGPIVPDSDPAVSESLVYKIASGSGNIAITLYLAEKTVTDKDGKISKETYNQVDVDLQPKSATVVSMKIGARFSQGCLMFTPGFHGKVNADLINCQGCSVLRFSRDCMAGCTYMVNSAKISSGVYWLKVKHSNMAKTVRLELLN